MTTPWFDPNLYGWIPGTLLGCLSGAWGGLAGTFAPQGKGKAFILGMAGLLLASAVVLLAAGLYALGIGQPYGVWYALGWPGLLVLALMIPGTAMVARAYRRAEDRRMTAQDIG